MFATRCDCAILASTGKNGNRAPIAQITSQMQATARCCRTIGLPTRSTMYSASRALLWQDVVQKNWSKKPAGFLMGFGGHAETLRLQLVIRYAVHSSAPNHWFCGRCLSIDESQLGKRRRTSCMERAPRLASSRALNAVTKRSSMELKVA